MSFVLAVTQQLFLRILAGTCQAKQCYTKYGEQGSQTTVDRDMISRYFFCNMICLSYVDSCCSLDIEHFYSDTRGHNAVHVSIKKYLKERDNEKRGSSQCETISDL